MPETLSVVLVLIGGVVCGFLAPRTGRSIVGLLLFAGLLVGVALTSRHFLSFSSPTVADVFLLTEASGFDSKYIVGSYACVIAAIVVFLRSAVAK